MKDKFDVSVNIDEHIIYPDDPPYDPPDKYPEFSDIDINLDASNLLYGHIRECIRNLGLDSDNYGTKHWNPFKEFIKKNDKVLIKPNLVLHFNGDSEDIAAVVTHASIVRPLLDYVLLALDGTGEIIIGDAPHGNADFEKIVNQNGIKKLVEYFQSKGHSISLIDFRKFKYEAGADGFLKGICKEYEGDPNGYVKVSLGEDSFLDELEDFNLLYGSDYNRKFIVDNHCKGRHRYLIAASVMYADVVISVPKLKTHKKTGVTINCKNLVGINGDKNYLAHYRIGDKKNGGDEHPETHHMLLSLLYKWDRFSRENILSSNTLVNRKIFRVLNIPFHVLRRIYCNMNSEGIIEHGDWYGNDTTWRMCLDLNYILLYADKKGKIQEVIQRKYFSLVDGIVSGEGNGPMEPTGKQAGYIACGLNQFMVDYVCMYHMGFDPMKLKVMSRVLKNKKMRFDEKMMKTICVGAGEKLDYRDVNLKFSPHFAWKGEVER